MDILDKFIKVFSPESDDPKEFEELLRKSFNEYKQRRQENREYLREQFIDKQKCGKNFISAEYTFESPEQAMDSVFERFMESIKLDMALTASSFDIDRLRNFYNDNLIHIPFAKIHVSILPDDEHIVLHFMGSINLNGMEVVICNLHGEGENSISRVIKGNDARFSLSSLGLTVFDLNKIAFRIKIGPQYIEGRL